MKREIITDKAARRGAACGKPKGCFFSPASDDRFFLPAQQPASPENGYRLTDASSGPSPVVL